MPELPEVQTIVNDLKKNVVGYRLVKTVVSKNYPKIENATEFASQIQGNSIVDVQRIAKNILLKLTNGKYIHMHLAMTGQILLLNLDQKSGKHAHVVFQLKNNLDNKLLTFLDIRMFGKVGLMTEADIQVLKNKYGSEPIDSMLNQDQLADEILKKRTNIKTVLLDQSIVAGLGNIYATEALFLAKINPKLQAKAISKERVLILLNKARQVLLEGISHRGSTLPDKTYIDIWGNPGTQQNYFNIYLKTVCPNCGTKVSFEKISGRGTYFCPKCQPE